MQALTNNTPELLPCLRQDLTIEQSANYWTGSPSFLIYDAIRNKYFRVGERVVSILSFWRQTTADKLARDVSNKLGTDYSVKDIENVAKFLITNSLIDRNRTDDWKQLLFQADAGKTSLWKAVIQKYLFFKIPLFRPQKLLNQVWPFCWFLLTWPAATMIGLLGIFSLYLVSRQWSVFINTFLDFLSPEGFLVYSISLVFIKIVHESGHALMARKYNVSVPIIGAAFILLMPILYTDTTSAHQLKSWKSRLQIDLAGIYFELALACIATLLWVFLPDGPMRSVAFSTATLSWVMSLAVNLNPFMRFDGYYILSDSIGVENLQERSFALAKWNLRETLFNLNHPPPEFFPRFWRRILISHAWGTWIYRLSLFFGIALIVYAFFIKIVGVILFALEIIWFIAMPIWRELKLWWTMKNSIKNKRRSFVTLTIVALLLMAFFIPWDKRIYIPAVMKQQNIISLYAPANAQMLSSRLTPNVKVKKGDVIAVFHSLALEESSNKLKREIKLLRARLARAQSDRQEQSLRLIIKSELEAKLTELAGNAQLSKRLSVIAPMDGRLADINSQLHMGRWVAKNTFIARIVPNKKLFLNAMVMEKDVQRLSENSKGFFFPNNFQKPSVKIGLQSVKLTDVNALENLYLAELYGGSISVIANKSATSQQEFLKPVNSWYSFEMEPETTQQLELFEKEVTVGTIVLNGRPKSYANRVFSQIASVLIRETSF